MFTRGEQPPAVLVPKRAPTHITQSDQTRTQRLDD
ncbi:hypothetical protein MKAN_13655 [Mycobacterium kansasii ATCC 12478]|uniref:Uncharacterized protein n=1 Tax=Mycobacterium kansasii ATCC 12478 TaxID=557599 RepID=U5WYD1_MYCKA|nr:hypothetical protein MKAN_13655 [Mycobacterium kansasii ATCC 12478]